MAGGAVLQQIDFVVPRGALAVVLGNSGSGKTTLLRGIMQVVFTCPCTR
jgi:ABC-type cobalamin/Fe3+-siderophores transport system ATPase subunit